MATFVLVHGAWQGGWVWRKVVPGLRAAGHEVHVAGLTGLGDRAHLLTAGCGLGTHVGDVLATMRTEDLQDVTLVGHSYSGMVITGVADAVPDRVSRLVYLDAIVPVDGESCWDILPDYRPVYYEGPADHGGWQVPAPPAELFHVNAGDRQWVDSLSTACSMAMFIERIRLTGDHQQVGRNDYVLATGWEANPLGPFRDRYADQPGWRVHSTEAGHNVMLDDPRYVLELLLDR